MMMSGALMRMPHDGVRTELADCDGHCRMPRPLVLMPLQNGDMLLQHKMLDVVAM